MINLIGCKLLRMIWLAVDFYARIDSYSLSTLKNRKGLIPLTSPSLKQPSILKTKHKKSRTSKPYGNKSAASLGDQVEGSSHQVAGLSCQVESSVECKTLSDSAELNCSSLESPLLFRVSKSESSSFSPSQVFNSIRYHLIMYDICSLTEELVLNNLSLVSTCFISINCCMEWNVFFSTDFIKQRPSDVPLAKGLHVMTSNFQNYLLRNYDLL